jgi:AcrR family transcriptional regulator
MTGKAEQTRALILQTGLRLLRERGYEGTTMRAIADEAGVSVGNAYHHFDSKEFLVQAFYDDLAVEHRAAAATVLGREHDLAARLRGVSRAWVLIAQPYHGFAGTFFRTAAEPTSPLSPFSPQSAPAREASIAIFREVLEGSDAKVDPQLRPELPQLLWLLHMGVVLYWVHDSSVGTRKTYELVDRSSSLAGRLVQLSRLRVLRPATYEVLDLIRELTAAD